jgi:hypothetical protein
MKTDREIAEYLRGKGFGVIPPEQFRIDMEDEFLEIWGKISPFTMTGVERGYALFQAVRYVAEENLPGDLVECGVWKGGSCMLMAHTLLRYKYPPRRIYLYDTFSGMTAPTEDDRIAWNKRRVLDKWEEDLRGIKNSFGSWSSGLDEVKGNLLSTGYPEELFTCIEGDVLETLGRNTPDQIALLRLDTDWYESTKKELQTLYPRVPEGGILIIDDYGHFTGARKAVDEYFAGNPVFLHRIDYTGRLVIKK